MKTMYVSLKTAADVQAFVGAITQLDGQFDFVIGDYILDAKSLMGVLTLDRSESLRLDIHGDIEIAQKVLQPFLIEE